MTAFNYTSGNVNNLDAGDSLSMVDIKGPLQDVQTFLNARTFNEDNLPVSLLQRLGLNDASGQKGRGKTVIAQTESRSNVAFGTLTTPDQVAGIVLPTDGLIVVTYRATWQESVNNGAQAAIFVGATQLKTPNPDTAAPGTVGANINSGAANVDKPLQTFFGGLITGTSNTTAYTGDVTTGQTVGVKGAAVNVGGPCYIEATAGTYTISVQFLASSGSVTAKNRTLRVWTVGF